LIDLDLDEVCDIKKTMETITEEEEDNGQEESGIREWTKEDNDKIENIRDPYNEL